MLALGQSYPQLNSSNNFLNLQENLADTEDKLAFARQYYNDAVATREPAASAPSRGCSSRRWPGCREREFYQTPR